MTPSSWQSRWANSWIAELAGQYFLMANLLALPILIQ
jgi:hypothetical protein